MAGHMESVRPEPVRRRVALGRYQLIAEIARGGMGVVYLASAQGAAGFRKLVVIKELKQDLAQDEDFVRMFMDEAKLSARLNHRNIVQTNEVSSDDGHYFMTMEYLEGRSLHRVLRRFDRKKDPSIDDFAIRALAETLAGLHYAHELSDYDGEPLGIVHRDVSPNNIFVTFDGQVKLLDFGVAKTLDRVQETQAGMLKGRVRYMAPEQVTGGVDRRADVFSAGAILREVVTGTRLWGDAGDVQILSSLARKEVPPFPIDEETPVAPELRRIVERAMAPEAKDRYATAHAMRVELETFLAGRGQLADFGIRTTELFAKEERELRQRIDAHLANAAGATELLRLEGNWGPSSGSGPSGGESVSSVSSAVSSMGTPAPPTPGSLTQMSSLGGAGALATPVSVVATPAKSGGMVLAIAGVAVALLVVAGVAGVYLMRGGSKVGANDAPVSPSSVPAGPTSGVPTAPPAASATTAHVVIRVSPANAQIFVDSASVGQNPFEANYPRSTDKHTIRAVAPGHAPKVEEMAFGSSEVSISLSLDRLGGGGMAYVPPAARSAGAPATSAAPAPTSTPMDIDPRGGKPPKRDIDPHDPYGGK
jgi:eukaryotic-like serine/threonine-protein kinase